jgi:hypothetical protein
MPLPVRHAAKGRNPTFLSLLEYWYVDKFIWTYEVEIPFGYAQGMLRSE